jgi:uncharacterized integral membrane protein
MLPWTCSRITLTVLLLILITFAFATPDQYEGTYLAWVFSASIIAVLLLIDCLFMDDKCFIFEVDRKVWI